MPCNDGPSPDWVQSLLDQQAMLCGIATVLADQNLLQHVLDSVDWSEAGVRRAVFEQWWDEHLRQDAARKRHEAEEKARQDMINSARSKLTAEEFAALTGRL